MKKALLCALTFMICGCSGGDNNPPKTPPPQPAPAPAITAEPAPEKPPASEPAKCDAKPAFAGAKGETAVEYLLGMKLPQNDDDRWAKDKRVCRYNSYVAVKLEELNAAVESRKQSQRAFLSGLDKENPDMDALSGLRARCAAETKLEAAIAAKLRKGAPPAFYRSNEALRAEIEKAAEASTARDAELARAVEQWQAAIARGDITRFPSDYIRSTLEKSSTGPGMTWKDILIEDSERYFDRPLKENHK